MAVITGERQSDPVRLKSAWNKKCASEIVTDASWFPSCGTTEIGLGEPIVGTEVLIAIFPTRKNLTHTSRTADARSRRTITLFVRFNFADCARLHLGPTGSSNSVAGSRWYLT